MLHASGALSCQVFPFSAHNTPMHIFQPSTRTEHQQPAPIVMVVMLLCLSLRPNLKATSDTA